MGKSLSIIPRTLASLWFWLFMVISAISLLPILIIIRLISKLADRRLIVIKAIYSFMARLYIFINPYWQLRIENRQEILKNQVYVMISNHQSYLDIVVLQCLFRHFRWVSKVENFSIPLLGWILIIAKDIRVDRSSPTSFSKLMRDCELAMKEGNSVMIFPEGTRSPEGEIQRFKEGAFRIAQFNQKSIIPIVLDGTRETMSRSGFIVRKKQIIKVRVLREIPYESFKNENPHNLAEKTRLTMSDSLLQLKKKIN